MAQRRWRMTRLESGDYLLPSNERTAWWRIVRYEERDGTLLRGDGSVVYGTFWSAYRWRHSFEDVAVEDVTDFDNWECVADFLPTRQAAIDAAMREIASHSGS